MKVIPLWIVALQMAAASCLCSTLHAQVISTGFPLPSGNWRVLITPTGYLDLIIDARPGFDGREYLSGEWAPAVGYDGHPPMWLEPQHVFPDWETNSDFITVMRDGQSVWVKDPMNPFNEDGNLVMESMQRNGHLEITHTYDIWNIGLNQGLRPHGNPPPDEVMIESDGFSYRHQLTFRNISGEPINNFRFYHLLHSLQGNYSVYDSTDHGGAMAEYKHDFTQRGLSYSFHESDGGLYAHTDYITAHSSVAPDAFSNGYYGIRGIDQHDIGKPSAGVHLDIENDSFTNVNEFEPKEGGWVASAARYPLGNLGVDESKTFTLLFSLRTMSELVYADPGAVLDTPMIEDGKLKLYIYDTMDLFNKVGLGFSLESNVSMNEPSEPWMPVPLPFTFNPAEPMRFSFDIPIDEMERQLHYRVRLNFGF